MWRRGAPTPTNAEIRLDVDSPGLSRVAGFMPHSSYVLRAALYQPLQCEGDTRVRKLEISRTDMYSVDLKLSELTSRKEILC